MTCNGTGSKPSYRNVVLCSNPGRYFGGTPTRRNIVKFLGTIAVALAAFTSVAYAADDPFANLYSNTLVYTTQKNVVIKVLVQKDGTWTSKSSDTKSDSGGWATLGNYVCVSDAAMPEVKPACDKIV